MTKLKKSLAALAATLLSATDAQAQTPAATAETDVARYPGPRASSQVCVRNGLDRAVGLSSTWSVGDAWTTSILGAGDTMVFRLVSDRDAFEAPQLTVRYREYAGSLRIATKALWSGPGYGANVDCRYLPTYVFHAEDDGHLRDHVVLSPIYYAVRAPD